MQVRPGGHVAPLRPDRRATLPLVVLVPPPLVLLARELSLCPSPFGCSGTVVAAYGGLAALAAAGAVLVARAAEGGRVPEWLAPRPDDPTLAALAVIVGGLALSVAGSILGLVPGWLGRPLAPVGLLLALPLAVVHAALVGSARSLGPHPTGVRFAATVLGIALSGAWWYALAKTVARRSSRVNEPRD